MNNLSMQTRNNDYLLRTILSINLISKFVKNPESGIQENTNENNVELSHITADDIDLIVYSFLIHERGKMPTLKPKDERYIIFRVHNELFIVTDFSPLYMLQYADDVNILCEFMVNGKIESEESDVFKEPGLQDINENHIIQWLSDNRQLWEKEVIQCLQRA
jgi:hypothetical protein